MRPSFVALDSSMKSSQLRAFFDAYGPFRLGRISDEIHRRIPTDKESPLDKGKYRNSGMRPDFSHAGKDGADRGPATLATLIREHWP